MAHYTVVHQTRFSEDHGEYHTYGLVAKQMSSDGRHIKAEIGDITTNLTAAEALAGRFNSGELSMIHFRDAVEDWLDGL